MKTDSAIRRSELMAVIKYKIENPGTIDGWNITTTWNNVGKTEANNVRAWDQFKRLTAGEFKNTNFIVQPPDIGLSDFGTIIPNDPKTFESHMMTFQDAWDTLYQRKIFFTWGYMEYFDIFGVFHTVRHCHVFTFQVNVITHRPDMQLPKLLMPECNRRTQKGTSNEPNDTQK